jgi:hypothetical protein
MALAVLSLALLACLLFRGPWKVTTIFAIFLLANTVLAKPKRKYFWGAIGVTVIIIVIWVFLPDKTQGWKPFTFDEEIAAFEAQRAVPDSENAAGIYYELLQEFAEYKKPRLKNGWLKNRTYSTFYPDFWNQELDDLTKSEPWSSADHPKISAWLMSHKKTINKLLEAAQIKECHFSVVTEPNGLSDFNKRSWPMMELARLLVRASNNDIADGRIDGAMEKSLAVLRIAEHQYQQPLMIDFTIGMVLERNIINQLKTVIINEGLTNNHLSSIETTFAANKHQWGTDWLNLIEGEKLLAKNGIASQTYEINTKGRIRLSRDPGTAYSTVYLFKAPLPTYWQNKLYKLGIVFRWFYIPSTPNKLSDAIDKAYESFYEMAEDQYDWQLCPREYPSILDNILVILECGLDYSSTTKILFNAVEPAIARKHEMHLRSAAERNGCRIIAALGKYKNQNGSWPESLEEIRHFVADEVLIDPMNGSEFVYATDEENFRLYSKGLNNIDENGENTSIADQRKPDDWLIWPDRMEMRRKKKEAANDETE